MSNFYILICKGFISTTIIAFIIGLLTKPNISLGAFIAGYSVLILSILMILIIIFNSGLIQTNGVSIIQLLYSSLFLAGPFILMLGIFSLILYLLIRYKDILTSDNISDLYKSFNYYITPLVIIQLCIILYGINNENFVYTGRISRLISSIIYLIASIVAIYSILLYYSLTYYVTDGFTMLSKSF